jgi:hypothetical protein
MLRTEPILTSTAASRARRIAVALARKQCEALTLYDSLPHIEPFHASRVMERILRGSNRGGKTLASCVEIARAICGMDPHDKYPKKNGRCFIVGKDGKHNSEVLYRKLFSWGAFQIIEDEETGMWRAFRPWHPEDNARARKARMAPPLVPPRAIKEISWESKKERVPNVIRMKNGWEARFFSSLGSPPQGSDIDLALFDEEIVNENWYTEIAARLLDRNGMFIWSATAQLGGYQLYELCMTAEKEHQENPDNPRIVEFRLHLDDNPHITQEMKDLFFAKLTPEQRRVRIEGEFQFLAQKVYPEFSPSKHLIDWFEIPDGWTRYLSVDPGRQVCGVVFAACPPNHHALAGHIILYDELYIRDCDNEKFGKAVREKVAHHRFQDFLIDHHGSRVRTMSDAGNQEEQLTDALKKYNVRSRLSKHGFTWGSPDVEAGIQAFRNWLVTGKNGKSTLLVMRDKLPNFQWEIDRYHYRKEKGLMTDKVEKRHDHLMDAARYLAMYQPRYHAPKQSVPRGVWDLVKKKRKKHEQKYGRKGITLGPVSRDV